MSNNSLTELLASWDSDYHPTSQPEENLTASQRLARLSQYTDDEAARREAAQPDPVEDIEQRLGQLEDERATELEERDAEKAIDWLRDEGIIDGDRSYTKMRLVGAYMSDPDFQEAWSNRDSDKAGFNARLREVGEKLSNELHSAQSAANRKMGAAVRAARSFDAAPVSSFDYDFGQLSDQDFWQAKQEIFQAAKAGQLK